MACCARGALANILFSIIHGCGCAPGRESTQRELTTPLVVLHRSTSPNCVIILRLLQTALGAELLSAFFQARIVLWLLAVNYYFKESYFLFHIIFKLLVLWR